ncbi:inorganic diphosphatase [Methanolobus halotolerans]|uniref:inorganic diphosphatase n=1 Tax=Methanolobus halotolerans TaxID=2052935 RepID=A0A4E0PXW4_9EURY|nr:inorganic diphosphatase [Methanolobus halotolerans]TGC09699.1 inorganic pyrophosphatase [Methanolobus halotolerans]
MRIVIETPKYSFLKYRKVGSQFKTEFFSPIPTLFNYGFVDGSLSEDGMEIDVVVIGPRMRKDTVIERFHFDGIVRFVDDSVQDNKYIVYIEGHFPVILFSFYFRLYALFKFFLYLLFKRKISKCRFEGIEFPASNYVQDPE